MPHRARDTMPHISIGEITIHGIPNWSTHIPKPLEKKVGAKAMLTVPPSLKALNFFSASAGSSTVSVTENPCGCWK